MPIPSISPAPIQASAKRSEAMQYMKKTPLVFVDDDNVNDSQSLDEIVLPELFSKTPHKQAEESGELEPEPLLTSNPHRFVLFPIHDSEVSFQQHGRRLFFSNTSSSDLGHVQESRSVLLDSRRN